MSNDQVQVIRDDDGVAFIGPSQLVEQFLEELGLHEEATDFPVDKLGQAMTAASGAASALGMFSEQSGKWLKLADESAAALSKTGPSLSKSTGLMTGVVRAENGQITKHLQFVASSGGSLLSPTMLMGAGAVMSQIAMQQQMNEISEYLEKIDVKLDRVIQNQKDEILSRLAGARTSVQRAMNAREISGRVIGPTWEMVQGIPAVLDAVQAHALLKIQSFVEELEGKKSVTERLDALQEGIPEVKEWLIVVAETFRLHDAHAIIQLDRVLETEPGELEAHHLSLESFREQRLWEVSNSTNKLLERLVQVGTLTDGQRVRQAVKAPKLVDASGEAVNGVMTFQSAVGLPGDEVEIASSTWSQAMAGLGTGAVEKVTTGAESAREKISTGVDSARDWGKETADTAREQFDQAALKRRTRIERKQLVDRVFSGKQSKDDQESSFMEKFRSRRRQNEQDE